MRTYTKDEALAELHSDSARGGEVYAWPPRYETDEAFAFVVVFRSDESQGWFKPSVEAWTVALHRKRVSRRLGVGIMRGWIEIDGFEDDAPQELAKCATAEKALEHAVQSYDVTEFLDYEAVGQRFRDRYLSD